MSSFDNRSYRIACYCRVSTLDQSVDLQKREILEYVRARGWSDVAFYEDQATGTTTNRPQFRRLIDDARSRRIDLVICWKMDRMARSLKDLVNTLQEFTDLGVSFIALRDNIDLTTSAGKLMANIIGAFAEFEVNLIRERVRSGLANAKAKGKRLGRPKSRNDAEIIQLRAQGMSIRQIAKQLNISKGAVQRSLGAVPKTHKNEGEKPQ